MREYVGTLGRHLLVEPDINQPYFSVLAPVPATTNENSIRPFPGYSTIQQFLSAATSNYHALQTQLSRRVGDVTFTAAYTFSKALGNASSDTDNQFDYYNLYWMYGPLSYDARHVFTGTFVWSLPRLKDQPAYVRSVAGNWQSSGVIHLQTGFPLNVTGNTPILGNRQADYIGGSALLPNPGANGWINPAVYAPAPQGAFGTAGAGDVRGPGLQTYDLFVARLFPLWHEGTSLGFRADFLNAFNNVNFQAPTTNVSNTGFGTITSAYPPRNIQLSLRLLF